MTRTETVKPKLFVGSDRKFQCRFCSIVSPTYLEVLGHELCVHPSEFPCRECREPVVELLVSHLNGNHGVKNLGVSAEVHSDSEESVTDDVEVDECRERVEVVVEDEDPEPFPADESVIRAEEVLVALEVVGQEFRQWMEDRQFVDVDDVTGPTEEDAPAEASLYFLKQVYDEIVLPPNVKVCKKKNPDLLGLTCAVCDQPFSTRPALARHTAKIHGDRSAFPYGCRRCSRTYSLRSSLIRHFAWARHGKLVPCRVVNCPAQFANREERRRHLVEVHKGYRCDQCSITFVRQESLRSHVLRLHAKENSGGGSGLACRLCETSGFENGDELLKHERKCRIKSNDLHRAEPQDQLERLRKYRRNQKGSLFPCGTCGLKLYSEERKWEHEKTSHLDDGRGEAAHKCPSCPAKFARLFDYKVHLRSHPDLARYPCGQCEKLFSSAAGRSRHVEAEHEKKRFLCGVCGLDFSLERTFLDHMSRHEGKPRYECPGCGMMFYSYPTFYAHTKSSCRLRGDVN